MYPEQFILKLVDCILLIYKKILKPTAYKINNFESILGDELLKLLHLSIWQHVVITFPIVPSVHDAAQDWIVVVAPSFNVVSFFKIQAYNF